MITLRDYQTECLESIHSANEKGIHKPLVCLPTASGKSIIFAYLAKQKNVHTLILAHRDELIEQAIDKLQIVWTEANCGVIKAERNEYNQQIVVASVQTLSRIKRLKDLPTDFNLIITDESHHSIASSYQRIYDHLGIHSHQLHLGVTATPNRMDKIGLGNVYQKVVYEKTILDMIQMGYLCDLQCKQIQTQIDISQVKTRGGDYDINGLAPLINTQNANELIVESWQEHANDRKTLAFTVDVSHAQQLCQAFRQEGIESEVVWGEMPLDKRRAILRDFANGNIQVLTNCAVLTEGYDNPPIDCILMARPTKSTSLFTQCIGRGTRIFPGKKDCLILDVACISDKHDLISYAKLFQLKELPNAGETLTDAVNRMKRPVQGYGTKPIPESIDLFEKSRLVWISLPNGFRLSLGTHGNISVYQDSKITNKYHVFHWDQQESTCITTKPVDISWALGIAESHAREVTDGRLALVLKSASWRKQPMTDKQRQIMQRYRIPFTEMTTKGEASTRISEQFAKSL